MAKTSVHLKACDIGASEAHNKREKELDYVKSELTHLNESYNYTGNSLQTELSNIRREVKQKTGRKLQKNAIPIKEGVIVIDEKTTMEDLRKYCETCQERFGIRPLQIHIHRDEGHARSKTWKPNFHAHIVWSMYNDQGRNVRLSKEDCRDMQTLAADVLGMERGEESSKKHLSSLLFKIQQQEQRIEELEAELKYKTEFTEKLKGAFEGSKQGVIDRLVGKSKKRAEQAEKRLVEARETLYKALEQSQQAKFQVDKANIELRKANQKLENMHDLSERVERLETNNKQLKEFIEDSALLGLSAKQMVDLQTKFKISCDSFQIFGNDIRRTDGKSVLVELKKGVIQIFNFGMERVRDFCTSVMHNAWYSINGIPNESRSNSLKR